MTSGCTETASELERAYDRALYERRLAKCQVIEALRLLRRELISADVYERFRVQDRAAVARVSRARARLRRENEQALPC